MTSKNETDDLFASYGAALRALAEGKLQEAEHFLTCAGQLNPAVPEVHNALGVLRMRQGRLSDAEAEFRHVLQLRPGDSDALVNLSNLLYESDRLTEAVQTCQQMVMGQSGDPKGWQNLGVLLQAAGSYKDAEDSFRRALSLDPGYATARWNLSQLLLLLGRFSEGWEGFEARFTKTDPVPRRHSEIPLWQGESLAGRTILVHAEQGYGSTIQFARYLPLVAAKGGRVLFECQDENIKTLFAELKGVSGLSSQSDSTPDADLQIPLMSLPRIFRTDLETIPCDVPYLIPDPALKAEWLERLGGHDRLRIGICWAGRPKPDPRRSCPLALFAPFWGVRSAIFYSLQIDRPAAELTSGYDQSPIVDMTRSIKNFADTAALIANLDLVITVDTVVAHLSGSLGIPTWTMLPKAADWRWLLDRVDSPWYPTMRLFRQRLSGDWGEVVNEMTLELRGLVERLIPAEQSPESRLSANLLETANDLASGKQWAQAEKIYRKALAAEAVIVDSLASVIHHNLGVILADQHRFEEAEAELLSALAREDSSRNHNSLGAVLQKKGDLDGAEIHYRLALSRDPHNVFALNNCGVVKEFRGFPMEAMAYYQLAVELKPDYGDALYNRALINLLLGDYVAGWADYDARWFKSANPVERRSIGLPEWAGNSCPNDDIFVYCEQGYGDTFQFIRFIPEVALRCRTVVVECQHANVSGLISRMEGVAATVSRGEPVPSSCTLSLPLGSLPRILGVTLGKLPYRQSYLSPLPQKAEFWQKRLQKVGCPKIGLVWAGNPGHENDRNRSCPLNELANLFALDGCSFLSLQMGTAAEQLSTSGCFSKVIDMGKEIRDFDDTAAILANLDLLITVDTSVAHLSAAMGRPTWVMIPFAPDWRWMREREDSPWYPSIRLFRQSAPGNWKELIENVRERLLLYSREVTNP